LDGKAATWNEALPKALAALKSAEETGKKIAVFIGGTVTNEEISAISDFFSRANGSYKVAAPDTEGLFELIASFNEDPNKKQNSPVLYDLVKQVAKRVKKADFAAGNAADDKLDKLISKSPNVRGLADSGIVNAGTNEVISSIRANEFSAVLFVEVTPESVGFKAEDLKNVTSISITSKICEPSITNITLASTPWSEKEGHFTGIFGAKSCVRIGMIPIGDERSVRWIFSH
jgi:hypothetical protein